MVADGNWGEGTGQGNVRKLGYTNDKSVHGYICSKLLAERAAMWQRYLIYRVENMYSSGSEIGMLEIFWMQLSIHTNDMLAVNIDYMIMCIKWLITQQQLKYVEGEGQLSVNDCRSFK